jgi:hypothetical protein
MFIAREALELTLPQHVLLGCWLPSTCTQPRKVSSASYSLLDCVAIFVFAPHTTRRARRFRSLSVVIFDRQVTSVEHYLFT